jgi:hypothetical protein
MICNHTTKVNSIQDSNEIAQLKILAKKRNTLMQKVHLSASQGQGFVIAGSLRSKNSDLIGVIEMNNDLRKLLGLCFIWLGACIVVAFSILGLSIGLASNKSGAAAPGYYGVFVGAIVGWYAFIMLIKITSGKSGNN